MSGKDAVAIAYDRTIEALLRCQSENATCTGNPRQRRYHDLPYCVSVAGIYVQPTALFHAGDVVLGHFNNGQAERLAVYGWSTKKRAAVLDLMQQHARDRGYSRSPVRCPRHGRSTLSQHFRRHPSCREERHEREDMFTNRTRLRLTLPAELSDEESTLERWAQPDVREACLEQLRAAQQRASVRSNRAPRRDRAPDSAIPVRTTSGASSKGAV